MKSKNKKPQLSKNLFPVVGVGASAGGLRAFTKFIEGIPENSGMAYVLVQHLDPNHQSLLPGLLQKTTHIPVLQVADDIKVEPNHIYIIPSAKIMKASDGVLELSPRTAKDKKEKNLPIDVFFTSLAEVHQSHAIGIVLSGTASDGTQGLKAIKDNGGLTFAQDGASAQYDGMPGSAVQAGVVDFVLPPEKMAPKIMEITRHLNKSDDEQQNISPEDGDAVHQILSLIRIRKKTDFSYYKKPTIYRRILRRMAINKFEKPLDYLKFLRENKPEQDILYQDLLIPVTSFFRDTATFDNLCSNVFPQIEKNKKPLDPVRIWIAACSTGQEAYSVAICFKEFLDGNTAANLKDKIQIFATDLSEIAITKARAGVYTKGEVENVSPQRLKAFFAKTNEGYQLNKDIRNMCVFARHNFLTDPPFSRMDFISCRNALIYMEPYLQKKALTTFHYALNKKGFLLLGKSETISSVPDLFAPFNKHEKLFLRKDKQGVTHHQKPVASGEPTFASFNQNTNTEPARTDFQKTADEVLLKKYTPPGVVINEAMDIVQFRGSTGAYLEPSPGKPSYNLLSMAKPGLAFELRNILHKAKTENKSIVKENIPFQVNGNPAKISLEAIPLPNMAEPHYLVLFHHQEESSRKKVAGSKKVEGSKRQGTISESESRIRQLKQELAQTHEDMRGITEEQEAANEELQSANEELLSSSEELQSLNEELETSSEELQSSNEELTVVNEELTNRNEQLSEARNYADSIIATIGEPLIVLDKNLRVKTANLSFYKTFKVDEKQTENKLVYDLGEGQWNIPELRTLLEKILPEKTTFSGYEVKHKFHEIGECVMVLNAREIKNDSSEKMILLAIEDITERAEAQSQSSLLENIVNSSEDAIISKTLEGVITSWNKGAENIFGYKAQDAIGKHITLIIPKEMYKEEGMIINKIKKGENIQHFHTVRTAKNGKRIDISLTISPIKDKTGKIIGASKIARNISEMKEAEHMIKESESRYSRLLQNLDIAIYTTDTDGYLTFYNDAAEELWGRKPKLGKDQWCGPWKIFRRDGTPVPLDECPMAITLKTGKYESDEVFVIERPDGSKRYMIPSSGAIFDSSGKPTGAINTLLDVTVQIKAQQDSEQLQRQKNDFLGIASHELKTPITVIKSYSQVLESILKEKGNLHEAAMASKMSQQVDKINSLIVDLLDTTKINSGQLQFNDIDFDFSKMVNEVFEDIKLTTTSHQLIIESNASCIVHADKERISQVVDNYVTNAIKYSPEGSKIIIRSELKNKEVVFSVQDFGIGIDAEKKDKVFEQFYRVPGKGAPNSYPGIGLGLYIASEIIRRENGRVWVESELGKGSVFYFSLHCT